MDIILHLGAHRTATTSFQYYMRKNARGLRDSGIGFWGPREMRGGLLAGALPQPGLLAPERQLARARGRVSLRLEAARHAGLRHLVISEENLIGSTRRNLRERRLYPDAGQRLARYAALFDGRITRAVICIRALDSYWMSAMAYAVARGARMPLATDLERVAQDGRGWRALIADLACALPDVPIVVLTHDSVAGRPEAKLRAMTDMTDPPLRHAREWLNRAPDAARLRALVAERGGDAQAIGTDEGPWRPFGDAQRAVLAETWADDLFWLHAGADGLARLTEETRPEDAGHTRTGPTTEGQGHDIEERRLA